MVNRKKRIEKGIDSLQREIEIHEEKKQQAQEMKNEELVDYYEREINALIERKKNREKILEKQWRIKFNRRADYLTSKNILERLLK